MKKITKVTTACFLSAIISLLLNACGAHTTNMTSRDAFASCKASCQQKSVQCNKTCRNSCSQCQAYVRQYSAEHFRRYAQEEYVKGGQIARDVRSYSDPLQCRKTSCSCAADYQMCMQSCGGVIHKQLQAAPVCL